MNPYTDDMNQIATYWEPTGNIEFGHSTFVNPITIMCRWQNKRDLIRSASGEQIASSAIVYVDRELSDSGWLALGDYTADGNNPRDVRQAYEIKQKGSSPDLEDNLILHKVWL